jgi:hypothetical protein
MMDVWGGRVRDGRVRGGEQGQACGRGKKS